MKKNEVYNMLEGMTSPNSTKFNKAEFQNLVYSIMVDDQFKIKKFMVKAGEVIEDDYSVYDAFVKFLDKFLKHAGMVDAGEREAVIDSFECTSKDVEWVSEAVDEAMFLYTESGKNLRVFRDKMRQLTLKKIDRHGEHEGRYSYRKMVSDKVELLLRARESEESKEQF